MYSINKCQTMLYGVVYQVSLLKFNVVMHQFQKENEEKTYELNVEEEPSLLAIFLPYVAVGAYKKTWIYELKPSLEGEHFTLLQAIENSGIQHKICLNSSFLCVLNKNGVISIDAIKDGEEKPIFLRKQAEKVTDVNLTENFLIYSTSSGRIYVSVLQSEELVNEYMHECSIKSISVDLDGTRMVFTDEVGNGYYLDLLYMRMKKLDCYPRTDTNIIWDDASGEYVYFLVESEKKITSYRVKRIVPDFETNCDLVVERWVFRPFVEPIKPIFLYFGFMGALKLHGGVCILMLFTYLPQNNSEEEKDLTGQFSLYNDKNLLLHYMNNICTLGRLDEAYILKRFKASRSLWAKIAKCCLQTLDFFSAKFVFQILGFPLDTLIASQFEKEENFDVLTGHANLRMGNFNTACDIFLKSSHPDLALNVQLDLQHWAVAMKLAETIAPEKVMYICYEHGNELEYLDDCPQALIMYEKALSLPVDENQKNAEYLDYAKKCTIGLARCSIRLGNSKRGMALAKQVGQKIVLKECSVLLEEAKQYRDAAALFEEAELYESAVSNLLRCKEYEKAGKLLFSHSLSPKLYEEYAKIREAEGQYRAAVEAYYIAKDWESCIKLNVEKIGAIDTAIEIAKSSKSIQGAKIISKYFLNIADHQYALQFLMMSECIEMAFQLAEKQGLMKQYAELLGDDASRMDYEKVAKFFEHQGSLFLAGKYYLKAEEYERAVNILMNLPPSGDDSEKLDLILKSVECSNSSSLTHSVIGYLLGEKDGIPKDARYLFQLYMASQRYKEAARTAVIIAKEEQKAGNYRSAHNLLLSMTQELRTRKLKVPAEMMYYLTILHSYVLAKLYIRRNEHLLGARLLTRVAQNISRFPAHTVQILTSTVIECQRTGLYHESFQYAAKLLKQEYRSSIDPKYERKIEGIVRKFDSSQMPADPVENKTPCPFCWEKIPEFSLACNICKASIPLCIASGMHLIQDDFTICPGCKFPAIYSKLISLSNEDVPCPMCGVLSKPEEIVRIPDMEAYLDCNETE